jgi:hypothetical protein
MVTKKLLELRYLAAKQQAEAIHQKIKDGKFKNPRIDLKELFNEEGKQWMNDLKKLNQRKLEEDLKAARIN